MEIEFCRRDIYVIDRQTESVLFSYEDCKYEKGAIAFIDLDGTEFCCYCGKRILFNGQPIHNVLDRITKE